jgi:hypothetical protein
MVRWLATFAASRSRAKSRQKASSKLCRYCAMRSLTSRLLIPWAISQNQPPLLTNVTGISRSNSVASAGVVMLTLPNTTTSQTSISRTVLLLHFIYREGFAFLGDTGTQRLDNEQQSVVGRHSDGPRRER